MCRLQNKLSEALLKFPLRRIIRKLGPILFFLTYGHCVFRVVEDILTLIVNISIVYLRYLLIYIYID